MGFQTTGHYGRFDYKLEVKLVKQAISVKLASKPYAILSLLIDPTNMDPNSGVRFKGIKLKEAWWTGRARWEQCDAPDTSTAVASVRVGGYPGSGMGTGTGSSGMGTGTGKGTGNSLY